MRDWIRSRRVHDHYVETNYRAAKTELLLMKFCSFVKQQSTFMWCAAPCAIENNYITRKWLVAIVTVTNDEKTRKKKLQNQLLKANSLINVRFFNSCSKQYFLIKQS